MGYDTLFEILEAELLQPPEFSTAIFWLQGWTLQTFKEGTWTSNVIKLESTLVCMTFLLFSH